MGDAARVYESDTRCQLLEEFFHCNLVQFVAISTSRAAPTVFALARRIGTDQIEQLPPPDQFEYQEHCAFAVLDHLQDFEQMNDVTVPAYAHHVTNLLRGQPALFQPPEVLWRYGRHGNVCRQRGAEDR